MFLKLRKKNGVSLIEMIVLVAALAIVALAISLLFKMIMKSNVSLYSGTQSVMTSQRITQLMEPDLYVANELQTAGTDNIQFIVDWNRAPDYNPKGDLDGDGILNEEDPDVDNDVTNFPTSGQLWQKGFNLRDDDDDMDGKIDMRIRFYLQGKTIYRDYSEDEEAWGHHVTVVATGVKSLTFTYFGAKDDTMGANIDTGADGVPNTGDTGENDGIITAQEIDATAPIGNHNGVLDTVTEFAFVRSIHVKIELDPTGNGKDILVSEVEIRPPLMAIKPLQ